MEDSEGTFHGFSPDLEDRIDYVLVPESVAVREYRAPRGSGRRVPIGPPPLLTVLEAWA
jgi:endonuclease/exonuclease/phosphatase family metal-dependent hydrolase